GKHVHSSTVVEAPDGQLIAAWFHGSGERTARDVVVQGARLKPGAQAWGEVFLMADTPNLPDCNPILSIDAQNRLWLFWVAVQSERWDRSLLKYRRAADFLGDGAPQWDWQDAILLAPGEAFPTQLKNGFAQLGYEDDMWAEFAPAYDEMLVEAAKDPVNRDDGWMTRCRLLTLPSGRMLLPLYSDGFNVSLVAYSDDQGGTWITSAPIVGLGNVQPSLAQKKDGSVVAFMRDNGDAPKRIMRAESTDDGETWTVARDIELPNPGSSVAALALADGRWILVFNDTEENRNSLAVALSDDEGDTWPHRRHIDQSKDEGFAYPTAIQAKDGRIHVTYSYSGPGGASIVHASFAPDWILAGD
ncbi:MAG: exo-alpha-sialidase, partial [Candidatus Hydrogenedentes bacterium]|nr:exo-alpha-sialidase [Candidatus Hydrogenedentota bacterium]